ncbi:DUF6474 family protein [Williamsia sp.]|uniref:DUF6474 family protein n=1 Tax=Williamsia sp. TaxID=1872085 RepID=UPI001A1BEE24|nr:DUF6474 family protein [Williamsia sp.]MBJ7288510.1 hypothetical protein [Williamsia sp.]
MGLFTSSRTTRAQKKAHAKALKAKAKLEARLDSRGIGKDRRKRRRQERKLGKKLIKAEQNATKTAAKTVADTNKTNLKIAKANADAAANGTSLTPRKVKRYLSVAKVVAPIAVPLAYRASTLARESITSYQANRAGVPIDELNKYSGHGAALSARVAGAERSLQTLAGTRGNDAETTKFVSTMTARLTDLTAAIGAAEHMPATRRRSAHQAIARELTAIDADLLARLGVRP